MPLRTPVDEQLAVDDPLARPAGDGAPPSAEGDEALLSRIRAGDDSALELLMRRHGLELYRFAFRLSGSKETAEEVVQDVFLRLARQPPSPRNEQSGALGSWLRVVAARLMANVQRGARRRTARDEHAASLGHAIERGAEQTLNPLEHVERSEERAQVRRALERLDGRQRTLLLLRYSGYRYAEIAEALGVSVTSVGTLLVRAEHDFRSAYALEVER